MATMRLRVRALAEVTAGELATAWSSQLCLSVPHIGEACDVASGLRKLQKAELGAERPKVLHYGHELGAKCPDSGRCVFLDYVQIGQAVQTVEVDLGSLVAKSK